MGFWNLDDVRLRGFQGDSQCNYQPAHKRKRREKREKSTKEKESKRARKNEGPVHQGGLW